MCCLGEEDVSSLVSREGTKGGTNKSVRGNVDESIVPDGRSAREKVPIFIMFLLT